MRDLVAHLVAWDELLLYRTRREHAEVLAKFAALYATSFASMRLLNYRLQRRTRDLDPPALGRRFAADDGADLKWLFDGTNPAAHLAEYVIHHEDIRRPLGLRRTVPSDRLAAALEAILRLSVAVDRFGQCDLLALIPSGAGSDEGHRLMIATPAWRCWVCMFGACSFG